MRKQKGLTLIELIIYISITMIILVIIIDLTINVTAQKSANVGQNQVNENTRFFAERLTYEIQSASEVSGLYPQDNLSLTVNGSPVVFTLSNGRFYIQEGINPQFALTEDNVLIEPLVGESIFNKVDNGIYPSIEIKFKITYKQANYSRDFQTTATLRGK